MKQKITNSFLLTILSSGLFFIFNLFLAKILGANIYGEIVYYLSFINIVTLLIGINYTGLYMGSRINKLNYKTLNLFISIESILFLIMIIPTYIIILNYINQKHIIWLILIIAYLVTIMGSIELELIASKKITASIIIGALLSRTLLILIFIGLFIFGYKDASTYLYSFSLSILSVVLYMLWSLKPSFYIQKEIFKRAWKFYLLGVIGTSFTYIAQILQKEYGSYIQLASLSLVLLFFTGLGLIGTVQVKFVLPKIHEYYRENNLIELGELYASNTLLEIILIVPMILFLFFNINSIAFMLGNGYAYLPSFFFILSVGFSIDLVTGITGNILRATHNEKYEILNELVRLIFGLGLIYLLRDHIYGIPIAISVSMVIYNLLKYIEVYILFGFIPVIPKQLFYILLFISMISMGLYIALSLPNIWANVLLQLFIILSAYRLIYRYIRSNPVILKGYK